MTKFIYRLIYTKPFALLKDGLWKNNPIITTVLGICSALAVTNKVENGIAMGLAVTFVVMASSAITAAIRNLIPQRIRMVTYMLIISTFVISVDLFMKGYVPDISRALGPYVALIITNCIVMGRAEAFASKSSVKFSILDAMSHGLGYTFVLLAISSIREFLAFGTIMNINIAGNSWTNWVVMSSAPGGFFVLAPIVWAVRSLQQDVDVEIEQHLPAPIKPATTIAATKPGASL